MGISRTLLCCAFVSVGAVTSTASLAATIDDTFPESSASLLERNDPRLFALLADADATSMNNRVHIERWYDNPGVNRPTSVIAETISNTDDAYDISASSQFLHELVLPTVDDDPYRVEAYPSNGDTQVVMWATIDETKDHETKDRVGTKPYARAYERTYERARINFESNILDIGRQLARVESADTGKLRYRQSWVSDSFRISRSEPPEHLIAADQIDNEFFSLRMTRWWNADDYALHVDYYLLVRDVEVLPDDEHRLHDAVVQAQNLLSFTVGDARAVVTAEADH